MPALDSYYLQFRWFCYFWGVQLTSDSGRSSLTNTLVWDGFWRGLRAWIPSRQIPICTRTHGDIQVFHCNFADFADLRKLPDQRFRKERSVHDACMGCILEGIEGLDSIETESNLHKDSWRYSGFSLQFRRFCWFWGFNWQDPEGSKSPESLRCGCKGIG